jgi:hypothetical protein
MPARRGLIGLGLGLLVLGCWGPARGGSGRGAPVRAAAAASPPAARAPGQLRYRWVYDRHNLLQESALHEVLAIMRRAKAAGYNGMVLADAKLQLLERLQPAYFRNVAVLKQTARELEFELIPMVCPIGYSSGILSHDPNLAEGLPVRDALFAVKEGAANLVADPPVSLKGGDFETAKADRFAGWELQDAPARATYADATIRHGGKHALRIESLRHVDPENGNGRVRQTVKVAPFRQYHLSVWVRTDSCQQPDKIRATILTPDDRPLSFVHWGVRRNQEWTQYHAVFNSLDNRELAVYLGIWEGKGGRIWFDDAHLEEVGLLNVLRRPGCPLVVKGEDGTVYEEGRDVLPVRDPKLERVPRSGTYDVYHQPPAIRLAPGSRIREGQRLRVSFYHNVIFNDGQVCSCLSEPKLYDLLRDQVERVNQLLEPRVFFMGHDEIRIANWCEACRARRMTPGQLLADNARRCVALIRGVRPGATVCAWSDMFDPNHNAHDHYFLVNGSWAGSWEGLPPDVVIANWDSEGRKQNMPWFAGLGHPQLLAGYYDGSPAEIRDWLADAKAVPNLAGAMYTTWEGRYDDLEAFAKAAW